MFKEQKVLVTGGSGLIGYHLIKILLDLGASVQAVVGSRHLPPDISNKVEQIRVDLSNFEDCKKIMKNIKFVFHLAAFVGGVKQNIEHPATMMSKNLPLNSNVIKAATEAGVERYAFVSCGCVYPDKEGILTEDMAWNGPPASGAIHFGWTKRIGELEAQAYHEEFGLKTAIIRPSNAYGPGDLYDEYRSHVIPALILKAVKRAEPFKIWGSGNSKRDFIYAEDVAKGILLSIEKYAVGDPINISTGRATSVNELASLILRLSGYDDAKIVHENASLGGSSSKILSTEKSAKIGFQPIISLEDGLKRTINSYNYDKY